MQTIQETIDSLEMVRQLFEVGVLQSGFWHQFYNCLAQEPTFNIKPTAKIVWLGTLPLVSEFSKTKKGTTKDFLELTVHDTTDSYQITIEKDKGLWFLDTLEQLSPQNKPQFFGQLKTNFETQFEDFELFWYSKPVHVLRDSGLLVL